MPSVLFSKENQVSFGTMFDGYCVIHAEHCTSERREWFERELNRVGVNEYSIVVAPKIDDCDPRLTRFKENYHRKARPRISLFEGLNKCIDIARKEKWRNVVIMEDDIIFRKRFSKWWSEVESEVADYNWDILFLYRMQRIRVELGGPTRLIPIKQTMNTHCFVIREEWFSAYQDARSWKIGGPSDSGKVFRKLRENHCRLVATSRNLAGQKRSFKSSRTGRKNVDTIHSCFWVHEIRHHRLYVCQIHDFYLDTDSSSSIGFRYHLISQKRKTRIPINDTAVMVWQCCKEPILVSDLLELIAERFPGVDSIEADVLFLLDQFYELDVIGFRDGDKN